MFHVFRVWKSFMHKRCMPRFSVEYFWSHNTGKPRSRTILCFRKFLVSNNFMDKRGGGLSRFSVRSFFRTVPKILRFCAVLIATRRGISIFSEFFSFQCRKIS